MHWGNYWHGGPKYPPGAKRYCTRCGAELTEETTVRRKDTGKVLSRCRECERERYQEYYRTHRDEILRKMREDPKRKEKDRRASKEKSRRYYARHKDDPEWRKRRNESSRRCRERQRERMGEEKYLMYKRLQQREYKARRKAAADSASGAA